MIALATIAFNKPRLVAEQIRLLKKYVLDRFELTVFDTSSDGRAAAEIADVCSAASITYWRLATNAHHEGLNAAAVYLLSGDAPHIGFLDHDIFPERNTALEPLIAEAGFYGVGQRHPATGRLYLWPGFCFFSREWLAGRPLDFSGLRDGDPRNDGDTGSGLWPLFAEEDWEKFFRSPHSYGLLRHPDGYGLQSYGYERIGDWLHLTNGSGWMKIPHPEERERLAMGLLANL